jgi:hypothetical protein
MTKHWLIRIGDGVNFWNSSKMNIWSASSKSDDDGYFIKHATEGDVLWFVPNKSKGHLVAVAVYKNWITRNVGPLIAITPTDEELGWNADGSKYDINIFYTDLIYIADLKLYSKINSPKVKRLYNPEKCKVDLPTEYSMIQRYKCLVPMPIGSSVPKPMATTPPPPVLSSSPSTAIIFDDSE